MNNLINRLRIPGAQPVPSVPDGWLRAVDEALVTAHIGVANAEDTYEQAREKLNKLIGWYTDVAIDPAVNGGYKLIPVEPTKEIYECFAAYDGTTYSNPFDFDDFREDYLAAINSTGLPVEAKLYALPCAQEQEPTRDWWDCLIADISAIDCMYRGSPTYAHDAYWMRDRVVWMLKKRRDTLPPCAQTQGE